MPKERNYNPVQAQHKADKARAIKKGKAEVQQKRNERLAKTNPERIKKQIDDLQAITAGGGKLSRHEEQVLEGLEKQLKAVVKARESLGDSAPTFGRGGGGPRDGGILGKRRRDNDLASSSDEDVPEDVKKIPMPRDTPPPIPKEILDKWYARRRARRQAQFGDRSDDKPESKEAKAPKAPAGEAKAVYEAKPVVRDLRKEAVSAFVPAAVRMKMTKGSGQGGLMEPEEADELEREGYLKVGTHSSDAGIGFESGSGPGRPRRVMMEEVEDDDG